MLEGGERNRILDGLEESTCPVDGCGGPVPRGYFTCRSCWRDVPDLLKGEIREAATETRHRRARSWDRWLDTAVRIVRLLDTDPDLRR